MAKQVRDRSEGLARLAGLGGDDAEIELRQFVRAGRGIHVRVKLVVSGDADAALD